MLLIMSSSKLWGDQVSWVVKLGWRWPELRREGQLEGGLPWLWRGGQRLAHGLTHHGGVAKVLRQKLRV